VDEQITALFKHPRSSSTHMHIEHEKLVKDHTIQQQVNFNTYFSAAIHLLMYLAERQLSGMADSSVMHVPMHMPTVITGTAGQFSVAPHLLQLVSSA